MALKLFISQEVVDAWVSAETAQLDGDVLTLRAAAGALQLAPASLFIAVSGGGADPNGLLGRVKDHEALAAAGGEAYMTSVLLGDVAYDVQPGFVGTPLIAPPDGGKALIAAVRAASP